MAQRIVLTAKDGHKLDAWRTDPKGRAKGGIVVLHFVYGINDHIGRVCDQWAAQGYAAIAPALYDRVGKNLLYPYGPEGVQAGAKIYDQIKDKPNQVLADIGAAVDALKPSGRVAVCGFCLGGTWTWVSAAELMIDAGSFNDVRPRLEPLATEGRPYRHSAREMLALAAWRSGDIESAKRWFDLIVSDIQTPPTIRDRVEMLIALVAAEGKI